MFQTKERDKTPEELSEVETGKEFIVVTVKMIQDLGKGMVAQTKKIQEMVKKEPTDLNNRVEQ